MDIDRFSEILDALTQRLPEAVYQELNLGIGVVERAKRDSRAKPGKPLYILGEYRTHPVMGRGILLYYGSFMRIFPGLDEDGMAQEIDQVLKHELTHHLESLAGSRQLEIADAQRLIRWQEDEKQP